MKSWPEHIEAVTTHARLGGPRNVFSYCVDYLLIDPESVTGPRFFAVNRPAFYSVDALGYGPRNGNLRGPVWARETFRRGGLTQPYDLRLLTQGALLGYVFNPVSFWFALREGRPLAFIAEVNNPGGDRHAYLCFNADFSPILPGQVLTARKTMHVSPFQEVAGDYRFSLDLSERHVDIRILHRNGGMGLCATLSGERRPLSGRSFLRAMVRRPLGGLRTITLIHWQALKLAAKRARWHRRPSPPETDVTQCS